jgi:hypothetical protein
MGLALSATAAIFAVRRLQLKKSFRRLERPRARVA